MRQFVDQSHFQSRDLEMDKTDSMLNSETLGRALASLSRPVLPRRVLLELGATKSVEAGRKNAIPT
jgi:hypothetical protein